MSVNPRTRRLLQVSDVVGNGAATSISKMKHGDAHRRFDLDALPSLFSGGPLKSFFPGDRGQEERKKTNSPFSPE